MDEMTGAGGEAATEVGGTQQTGATEAAGTNTQSQAAQESWKVGDTTFGTPKELHQGALRWQGDFTRVSQQNAALTKELGGYRAVFNIVTQDPRLRQEVMQRMQGGQSQQQAVQQTAQAHPEMLQKFSSLEQQVSQLTNYQRELEQDRAQYDFKEKHQDVSDKEWTTMAEFIGKNHEWFGQSVTPYQMIEFAYNNAVLPLRLQAAHSAGQQAAQDEIKRGAQKPLLGSPAASATSRAQSAERPKGKLNPAQERAHAQKVWDRSRNQR